MLKIAEQLKQHALSRFHLLYGEERYMVDYYRNCIKKELSAPDDEMNCTFFRGDNITPQEIADVAQILPFMASQRLIVVKDSGFFDKSSEMTDYLEHFPETTYIVFTERKVDKRNKLYKWISKNGCVTECQNQTEPMLKQWIAGYLKKQDKAISVATTEHLLERAGTSMENLNNELDKLIGYVGERKVVEIADVDAICSGVTVSHIFEMMDAVAQKERERALSLYADLIANREQPMTILYLFSRHINILIQVRELSGMGLNRSEMAKKIGVPPFTIPKYERQAKHFKRSKLLSMLEQRADCEENFKMGRIRDQLAVELFLIRILTEV